ncbi:MAG: hypothetical protein KAW12_14125 [Candidatus Aminicenantes bacterium]|nr:hypothetical protein [Candidatus Aminicenantes bacterium]
MTDRNKNTLSKIFLGAAVLLLFSLYSTAVIYYNEAPKGLCGSGESSSSTTETLNGYVIEGAGYFLGSYSDFLHFLKLIELAELDGLQYGEAGMTLDRAIEKMENAKEVYTMLKEAADNTPYDPVVIEKLLNFDYDWFQKKNGLNEPIFDKVKGYLEKGEIKELFGKALSDTEEVLKIAKKIKASIDAEEIPELSILWDLDETLSQSLRFGQYVARVFHDI